MRFAAFLVALAIFSSNAIGLAEYGFLLEAKNSSFFSTLQAKPCAGFLSAKTEIAKNARSDFALQKAMQAIGDFKKAKAYASLQPALNKFTLHAYRYYAAYCFSYGQKALREASEAAKEGLRIIDEDSRKLERMIGPGFQGFAGGVVQELGEAKNAIEKRNHQGKGFGNEFSKTVLFLLNKTQTAGEISRAVEGLVGIESILEKEISLDDRVLKAIFLLESEYNEHTEENEILRTRTKLLRDFLEGEKLVGVGENAFYLIGDAFAVSSSGSIESFEKDFRTSESLEKTSAEKTQQAHSAWDKKEEGFASKAISLMSEANQGLKTEEKILQEMDERSESLEESLKRKTLEEKAVAERMLSQANALAAARARVLLQKAFEPARLSTRGERVIFYASKITELKSIQGILEETVSDQALRLSAQAKAELLQELVSRASKDIPLETEEKRLGEIILSIETATPEENLFFSSQLGEIYESILARLYDKYGGLEAGFQELEPIAQYLGESAHSKFLGLQQFFPYGSLDLEASTGKLSQIQSTLSQVSSLAKEKTPAILKKHLEESAIVKRDYGLPKSGEKTLVKTTILFTNSLPLETGRLGLDFEIPDSARVTAKSPEVSVARKVFLEKVEADADYSVGYETEEEIVEIVDRKIEVRSADFLQASAQEKIVFTSTEDAEVLLVFREEFPLEFAEAKTANTVFFTDGNSTEVRILTKAKKGYNQIELALVVPEPVEFEEAYNNYGNRTDVSLALESKHLDLKGFYAQFSEETCEGKARTSGSLNAKARNEDSILTVEISESELRRFERKGAVITLECGMQGGGYAGDSDGSQPFTREFNSLLAQEIYAQIKELRKECEECVLDAEKFLLLGDLGKAAEELEKAQMLAIGKREEKAVEKQAFEDAARDFEALKEKVFAALDSFDSAFAPFEEKPKEVEKSILYQQGKKLKAEIEKMLKEAEKAKTAGQLEPAMQRLESKAQAIAETVAQQEQKALDEISLAELKQKQYGTQDTLYSLKKAKEFGEKGNSFTAWAIARDLNSLFNKSGEVQEKENGTALYLGVAGALVLIALAFFFLRKNAPREE